MHGTNITALTMMPTRTAMILRQALTRLTMLLMTATVAMTTPLSPLPSTLAAAKVTVLTRNSRLKPKNQQLQAPKKKILEM